MSSGDPMSAAQAYLQSLMNATEITYNGTHQPDYMKIMADTRFSLGRWCSTNYDGLKRILTTNDLQETFIYEGVTMNQWSKMQKHMLNLLD